MEAKNKKGVFDCAKKCKESNKVKTCIFIRYDNIEVNGNKNSFS